MSATWSIQTPPTPGAIAVIQILAADAGALEGALSRLEVAPIAPGRVALRSIAGVDTGLVARWTADSVHLMPHGGAAVVRAIARKLFEAGLVEALSPPARRVYPEARSDLEAEMFAALARAASPLAVDLLLDQPRRWAAGEFIPDEMARPLSRLIGPPLVVAIGPPNIGKSSLVNALAGRAVSIVADEPGTTRDHVGVLLDLAGLVVRYIDTPGVRAAVDSIERDALALAERAAAGADLVLRCGDGTSPPPPARGRQLTIALRADLGTPAWRHDAAVTVVGSEVEGSLANLVRLVRDWLVPPRLLADARAWRFC